MKFRNVITVALMLCMKINILVMPENNLRQFNTTINTAKNDNNENNSHKFGIVIGF